jgi:hypothetical protein
MLLPRTQYNDSEKVSRPKPDISEVHQIDSLLFMLHFRDFKAIQQ